MSFELDEKKIRDVVQQVLTEVLSVEKPSGRRLADENLARWLGHAPSKKKATFKVRSAAGLPAISPALSESAHQHSTDSSEGHLIPNPKKPEKLEAMLEHTPARIGVWRTGTRYLTKVALQFMADHAIAKDAVYAELKSELATQNGWTPLYTKAKNKEEFLLRPDLGRELSDESLKIVQEKGIKNPDIQITVADGLSSWAAERYAVTMVNELKTLFASENYSVGTIFFVKYSRIAIQDVIGEAVGAKISMILLGERPGLGTGDSLSNYIVYGPKVGIVNAKKSMISNIRQAGLPPEAAAKLTLEMVTKMFEQKCSGVDLRI